jgi:predicted Zn-dependent protease
MTVFGRLLLAALLVGCSIPGSNPLQQEITVEQEMEIGAEIHEQLRQSGVLVTDLILLDYLNDLGQQIVRVTEPQPFIYRFNLVESDDLNAFAVPGGYIYIHTGVVEQAGNVSELAGVLAHEIAHVRRRHIANSQKNQGLIQLATLAAAILSGGHPGAIAVAQGINVSLQLKYTRENEVDADHQGVDYMVRAGYDPRGMIRFFERILADIGPNRPPVPPYLFTHPALQERISTVEALIERTRPPTNLVQTDPRLHDMQTRLAALRASVAGGTGLHARQSFDRSKTDPFLERAQVALQAERLQEADETLQEAEMLEPGDPRIPLARADIAERQDRLEDAADHLRRAVELDPNVPLVHYRLGVLHKRLGNRSEAVFHLEQAVSGFGPTSSLRNRAELEIRTLSFPLLEDSDLGTGGRFDRTEREEFFVGDTVTWWGSISRQLMSKNPLLRVRWIGPGGNVAEEDRVRMDPFGHFSADLDTTERPPGKWQVRVLAGDSIVDRRTFRLTPAPVGN